MKNDPPPLRRLRAVRKVYSDKPSALSRFRLRPDQSVCSAVLREHVAEHSLRQVLDGWTWKFDPRLADADTLIDPDLLGRVRTPVDFVYGECSLALTAERAARIARATATSRALVSIPGGHHHLMLDQPIALVSVLRALLGRC
jgi:pimeloyl-ACP methyl ester carboxylesterase